MKVTDFTNNTLDSTKQTMDFNGYSWFNYDTYTAKNDTPCFIPENADNLEDVESWDSLFNECLTTIKTRNFLLAVCENYGKNHLINYIETVNKLDFEQCYLTITGDNPEKFAEDFMDSYFLGGDDVWCSLSTKLQDYTY